MNGKVDVRIEFANRENATFERSQWLNGLQSEYRRSQIDCTAKKMPAPENTQSLGFTEWIEIIGCLAGVLGTVFGMLSFYLERNQPKKTIKGISVIITDSLGSKISLEKVENKNVDIIIQKIKNLNFEQTSIKITVHD